jgi:quinol monooxygenase YgiN
MPGKNAVARSLALIFCKAAAARRFKCRPSQEEVIMVTGAHQAAAQSGPLQVKVAEVDVVPGRVDTYLAALKENAAASVHEAGCREFNVMVSQKDPNHVLIFEVYDDAAAFEAHLETDHFKKFAAATKGMAAKVELRAFASVAINTKG